MTTKKTKTKKKPTKKSTKKKVLKKSGPEKGEEMPEGYTFGRPTKYKKEFCALLLEKSKTGECLTRASLCVLLDIDFDTLQAWEKKHLDFSEAIKKSEVHRMHHMEAKGFAGINAGKQFNAVPWLFLTKNMFPKHYADKKEVAIEATEDAKKTFAFTLEKDVEKI